MDDFNITLFEACEFLNRSKKSISRYIRRGLLHPQEIKSQQGTLEYRFSDSELKAFKEKENESRQDRGDTQDRTEGTPDTKKIIAETAENKENALDKSNLAETGQGRQDRGDKTGHQVAKEITNTTKKKENLLDKRQTGETGHHAPDETRQDSEIITLLKETTWLLRDQLKTKDEQIKDLGGKIDQLIERSRETNILIGQLQSKVLMLEKPREPIVSEITEETGQDTPDKTGRDKQAKPLKEKKTKPAKTPEKKGFWQRIFK